MFKGLVTVQREKMAEGDRLNLNEAFKHLKLKHKHYAKSLAMYMADKQLAVKIHQVDNKTREDLLE